MPSSLLKRLTRQKKLLFLFLLSLFVWQLWYAKPFPSNELGETHETRPRSRAILPSVSPTTDKDALKTTFHCGPNRRWCFHGSGLFEATAQETSFFYAVPCNTSNIGIPWTEKECPAGDCRNPTIIETYFESMDRQKPLVRVGIQPVYEHGRYKLIYTLPEPGEYKLIASHQNSVFFNGSIAPIRVSPRRHPALPRQECGSRKDIAAALQKSGYWKNDVFYPQCDIQQSKTLCADLQGKDIKRVAIIGDSLSRHLFVTVVSMLSDKGTITDDEVFLLLLGDNPSEEIKTKCGGKQMYKNDAFCHSHIKAGVIPVCQNAVKVSIYYEFKVKEDDDTFRNMIWKEQPDLAILNIGTHELFIENYSKVISQDELLGRLPTLLDYMASTLDGLKGHVVWWTLPPALGGGTHDLRSYEKTLRQYDLTGLHRKHFEKLKEKGSFTILDTHFMGLGGFLRVDVTHYNYVFNQMLLQTIIKWLRSN